MAAVADFDCSPAAEEINPVREGEEVTMQKSIPELSNDQVIWEGNPIGLAPTLTRERWAMSNPHPKTLPPSAD